MTVKRVAFIGSGYMAREHAKAFAAIDGVALVGVYGRNFETAEKFAKDFCIKSFPSIEQLHGETKADLVVVAVDELSIIDVCEQAFQVPWTILLEKPPGYRPADARALLVKAQRLGRSCYVALNRRFMSSAQNAKGRLDNNPHQRLIVVHDQEDVAEAEKYGQPKDVLSHWMYANAIHLIDLLRFFGRGRVKSVTRLLPWKNSSEASLVVASIEFESGDIGLYKGVWNAPSPWMAEIVTSTERFELRPLESLYRQARGQRSLEQIPSEPVDTNFKPGLYLQAQQAKSMLEGNVSHQLPTLAEAVESMNLIEEIFKPDSAALK